jgi:glutaminyl-peptide cyclotransferase
VIEQAWNHVTAGGDTLPMRNYIARFNLAARERVLYLAHWDTRPISDNKDYTGDRTRPVPGASDGASGVAVLLGVADVLKRAPAKVGVDLLFVDGEDYGDFHASSPNDVLIGSRYYAQHQVAGSKPLYAILFDMVGDKDLTIKQEGNSQLGAPEVVELVWTVAREIGHGQYFMTGQGHTLTDDHVELQKAGIRAIDVVDFDYGPNNSYWHTPDDTIDKVSAASLQIVGDVAMALIRRH